MASLLDRVDYQVSQAAKMAWYGGHYLALRRMSGPLTPPGEPAFKPAGAVPDGREAIRALRELTAREWRNIEQGFYAKPHDRVRNPRRLISDSIRFLRDVPRVEERRMGRNNSEVFTEDRKGQYPRYYLQNFHYQTDGWLSDESARLYDTQVEVLFTGTADLMRRMALVPLAEALKGKDQRHMSLLDVATGTGRFLTFVKDNYPKLPVTALDLSGAYLDEARRNLKPWSGVDFVEANAETMPFDDGAHDVVTSIYLFHELPPKIRRVVAREIARVLKPGGTFILVDSIQYGDASEWDGILESFPVGFHEPYYMGYLSEDLAALFSEAGLEFCWSDHGFLSKVAVFRAR